MIRHIKIKNDDGDGEIYIFDSPDFEYVNPIKHYSTAFIASNFEVGKTLISHNKPPLPYPLEVIEIVVMKEALKNWAKKLEETLDTEIPENFIGILKSQSKKEQVKLLKNQSLTSKQLLAFIFKACTDFGFLFSQYRAEHHHRGLEISDLPVVVMKTEGKVHKIGKTTLTDGQLQQAIKHRSVIVSKFLDNGNEWHCLFLTYDSINGKESWKCGQPHFHYISDKFGIPRKKVIEQLKSRNYKLGSLPHIDIIDYYQQT